MYYNILVLSSSSWSVSSGSSLSSSLLLARGSYIKGWTIGACKISLQACSVSPVDTVLAVAGKKHSCCSSCAVKKY